MTKFGIVGAGWRTEFFLRIAKALPDRFAVTAMAVRNKERAVEIEQTWHIPTFPDVRAMVDGAEVDFAVVSVPRQVAPAITLDLLGAGVPVLTESPPAAGLGEMTELWRAVGPHARVQVAEQYQYQPDHAAQLALARSGALGQRYSARISAAHGYHAISLIRLFLDTGFAPAVLRGVTSTHPTVASAGRDGVIPPGQVTERESLATVELDGKLGVYDFSSEQYFSRVRTGNVTVRGDHGELRGRRVSYLNSSGEPAVSYLQRDEVGRGTNLEGFGLRSITFNGEPCYTNPFGPVPLPDEEVAIATCLARMGEFVSSGTDFYPLREALEDQYLSLALEEALATGGPVNTSLQPWAS